MTEKSGHILIVDDMQENCAVLSDYLRQQGYSISVATRGQQALDMVREEPFDLILLDIMMPRMSGHEVLGRIKSDKELRHIPVVVISGVTQIDSIVKSLELGAEDYLTRPFNETILNARVGACLEKNRLHKQEIECLKTIEQEKKRSDDLLRVILPANIAEELKKSNSVKPRRCEEVGVLFADVVDFAAYCDRRNPDEVLTRLQEMVSSFEELADKHGLEKIKTIGDCFMATAGLLKPVESPVESCARCGLEMIEAARSLTPGWDLRVGIHCGPVVAGIVGYRQYLFDVWGDTVNTAYRIEQHGKAGFVNLSNEAWLKISGQFKGEFLGVFSTKGTGRLEIYRILK